MGSKSNNLRKLGEFEIDLEKKTLWVNDTPSGLPVKAVELLCVLIENEGDLLSKEDLLKKVWQDSFVEEGVLPQNIYTLRKIFRQHGLSEDLIQTVPRRGYRFVQSPRSSNGDTEITIERETVEETYVSRSEYSEEPSPQAVTAHGQLPAIPRRSNRLPAYLALAAVVAALVFGLSWMWNRAGASVRQTEDKLASIAVAPFFLISDKPDTSAVARRGIAEAVIFRLKQIRDIRVSELKEIEPYFSSEMEPISMARTLGYQSVVTGTIRIEDSNLRVNFELISAVDGSKNVAESFSVQQGPGATGENPIALRVARKIDIHVAEMRDAASVPPGLLDADTLQAYVLAQKLPREFDLNRREEAVELMKRVVAAAPNWAMAHAKLGESLAQANTVENCEAAIASADRALELDRSNAVAYIVYGSCTLLNADFRKAEYYFRRAVDLDPADVRANLELGQVLDFQRRFAEAERFLNRGMELEPLSPYHNFVRCQHYYFDKKLERAIADCEQALQLEPGYVLARKQMYWNYVILNRWDKVLDNAFGELSDEDIRRHPFARPLMNGDLEGYWRAQLEWRKTTKRRQHSPMAIAASHSMLSEVPETLELLEQAAREKHYQIRYVYADPIWDSVRREPRYLKLVQDLGLAESTATQY